MEASSAPSCIHRFIVKVRMDKKEESLKTVSRSLLFSTKKQNASWTIAFVISATQAKINFSTNPASVLQETHRIICSILNDSALGVITFEGHEASLHKDLAFYEWHDVLKVCKSEGFMQICIDIIESSSVGSVGPKPIINMQMLSFFENGEHSDVLIKTELKEIPAHKIVLAARSSVFAAMFRNDMQEMRTGTVTVKNVKTEVLEEMLHYMYCNISEKLPEMACELFAAAHMYDVEDLQRLCIDYLMNNIRVKNVTEILKLCHMYNLLKNVETRALKFVDANEALVIKQKEYLLYLMENVKVENIVESLILAQKYKLAVFKQFLMDFIAKNYSSVMKNDNYRELYLGRNSMVLIREIDEHVSTYITKLHTQYGIK